MKNHQRKSNFELMRIISMFMIVINHIIDRNLIVSTSGTTQLIILFINMIIRIHVCSFVLLTGYFGYKQQQKLSKIISINNSVWFYNILAFLILSIFGVLSLTNIEKISILSPFCYNNYWFIVTYLLLYLISPLLNIIISNINKIKFQKIIISLFILFSIMTSLTGNTIYNNNSGFSLTNFILLYFLGSYLSLYPIKQSFIFKNTTNNLYRFILVILFFLLAIINLLIYYSSNSISSYGSVVGHFAGILRAMIFNYDNPIIIIQAIVYFLFFESLSFKNKIVNKIGGYILGIYLVHENPLTRPYIYKFLGFTQVSYGILIIPKILISAVIIFIGSLLIEIIRKSIFKFIYHRKFSCKFRNWYRNYIKSLGLNINW